MLTAKHVVGDLSVNQKDEIEIEIAPDIFVSPLEVIIPFEENAIFDRIFPELYFLNFKGNILQMYNVTNKTGISFQAFLYLVLGFLQSEQ